MNNANQTVAETGIKPHLHPQISPTLYEGIYHSNSINKSPAEVYAFCQVQTNLNQVLNDLPEDIENFLDLQFVNATALSEGKFRVEWKNNEASKIKGTLTLNLSPGHASKGTTVIANALFADYKMDNDGPSDLINLFLKRFKSLAETGQLATIKGQPNGKDEDELKKSETIKH